MVMSHGDLYILVIGINLLTLNFVKMVQVFIILIVLDSRSKITRILHFVKFL